MFFSRDYFLAHFYLLIFMLKSVIVPFLSIQNSICLLLLLRFLPRALNVLGNYFTTELHAQTLSASYLIMLLKV